MKIWFSPLLLVACLGCKDNMPVYICSGPNARRYHFKEHCGGLGNCTYEIKRISLAEAKEQGRTLCHWESREDRVK